MHEKNDWIIKTLIGIVWVIIFAILTGLVNATVINEKASQDRDVILHTRATSNETRIGRLEESQLYSKEQFTDIKAQITRMDSKLDRLLNK